MAGCQGLAAMNRMNSSIMLIVRQGRQAGTRVPLQPEHRVTVGNDLENDIVLYSGQSATWSIALDCTADNMDITLLVGKIDIAGAALGNDEHGQFDYGETLSIDSLVFTIERLGMTEKALLSDSALDTPERYGDDEQRPNGLPGLAARWSQRISQTGQWVVPVACVVLGLGVLGVLPQLFASNKTTPTTLDASAAVDQLLSASEFSDVVYLPGAMPQQGIFTGAVKSRDHRGQLLEAAARSGIEASTDLQINDEFADTIGDVYRVHGIDAEVRVLDVGVAEVLTRTDKLDVLLKVETQLKQDVAALESLTVNNNSPEPLTVESKVKHFDDPDKRVTLVVAGENGYIMTADASRYFVGSMLPTGYIIKKIHQGTVILVKDGKDITLNF